MLGHPDRSELLDYACCLADNRPAPVSVASHVFRCPACQKAVTEMRATLTITAIPRELEPSRDFTAQVLLAAHRERHADAANNFRRSPAVGFMKLALCAAGLLLVAALSYSTALQGAAFSASRGDSTASLVRARTALQPQSTVPVASVLASADSLGRVLSEIETFTTAMAGVSSKPAGVLEREHRRAIESLGIDLKAAREALRRNPGCPRATAMVDTGLQRQAQVLRKLYLERGL